MDPDPGVLDDLLSEVVIARDRAGKPEERGMLTLDEEAEGGRVSREDAADERALSSLSAAPTTANLLREGVPTFSL